MSRRITLSVTSALLAIGLVGCAANNPTKDSDVIRDRSVEDRIRQGESLSQKKEENERSAQRERERAASSNYGYDGGVGGTRKKSDSRTRGTSAENEKDSKDKDSVKATSEDRFANSLASLMGKSGGNSNMGMWMGLLAAGLMVKGGDLLKGGTDAAKALLGGDKKDGDKKASASTGEALPARSADGTETKDLRGGALTPANTASPQGSSVNVTASSASPAPAEKSVEQILRFSGMNQYLSGAQTSTAAAPAPAQSPAPAQLPVSATPAVPAPVASTPPASTPASIPAAQATTTSAPPSGQEVLRFAMKPPEPIIPLQPVLGKEAVHPDLEKVYWEVINAKAQR